MNQIRVVPLESGTGISDFLAAARCAQEVNPRWVEQVHAEVRMLLDPRRGPLARQNDLQAFVAYRDGKPVGRIAAIVDSAHIAKYNDACGHFGFLDAIDDPEVFAALFEAAEHFLRSRGMRTARGPFSLTINQETGLLVDGFDEPHVVGTNHSPPHYARRVEALGYAKAIDLLAYVCRVSEARTVERVAVQARRRNAPDIEAVSLSYRSWRRDLPRIIALYNDAWSDNLWSTPIGEEEAKLIGRMMLPVCKPSWIHIARYRGEDVALMAQIPDVNEALRGLDGRMLPFGFAKLLWRVHVDGVRRTRVAMAGMAKKWRDAPLAVLAVAQLMARVIEDAREAHVEEVECSWILETNHTALNAVSRLPARRTRTFRVYERKL